MLYIAHNIRFLRKRAGYSQEDLASLLGYKADKSFTTIQKWESGVSTPPLKVFVRMAELFGVDLDDFTYIDLSDSLNVSKNKRHSSSVPVYGRIPAGVPAEAIEDIDGYIEIEGQGKNTSSDFFALRIEGSSMLPEYRDGDIVLFERQNTCDSGSDCAVRVGDNDATFKKVRDMADFVILQPINPDYEPIQVSKGGDVPFEILGVAKEIRRKI